MECTASHWAACTGDRRLVRLPACEENLGGRERGKGIDRPLFDEAQHETVPSLDASCREDQVTTRVAGETKARAGCTGRDRAIRHRQQLEIR